MKKKSFMKILISFTLILLVISINVFAYPYTDYENLHRSHYKKLGFFSYLNPYSYGDNGKVNIAYTYTENGSNFFGFRIMMAAQTLSGTNTYNNYHMDYDDYAPFNVIESTTDTNMSITTDDYGNVDWAGICSTSSKVKAIRINENAISDPTYDHDISEYTIVILHEMLHACGLDHYSCEDEVMRTSVRGENFNLKPGDIGGIYDKY